MRVHQIIALAAVAVLVGGCSRISVSTDFDPSVNFARLSRYAWLDREAPKGGDPRLENSLMARRVIEAVDARLGEGGYERADDGSEDFLVTYHLGVDTKIDVTESPARFGYGWWSGWWVALGGGTVVDQYEEGTLLIDIIAPKSRELIWRGAGTSRLRNDGTPQERDERVRKAVQAILEDFPPTP